MTIYNRAEITARNDLLLADNESNLITPAKHREMNEHIFDSYSPYACVIEADNSGAPPAIGITASPQIIQSDVSFTSENGIFIPDEVNNRIVVKEPCFCLGTVRLQGQWNTGEDLNLAVYLNGAANPLSPGAIRVEGKGGNDPETISVANFGYPVQQAFVDANPGGIGGAEVTLVAWSTTGNFTLDLIVMELGLVYQAMSIRNVG